MCLLDCYCMVFKKTTKITHSRTHTQFATQHHIYSFFVYQLFLHFHRVYCQKRVVLEGILKCIFFIKISICDLYHQNVMENTSATVTLLFYTYAIPCIYEGDVPGFFNVYINEMWLKSARYWMQHFVLITKSV